MLTFSVMSVARAEPPSITDKSLGAFLSILQSAKQAISDDVVSNTETHTLTAYIAESKASPAIANKLDREIFGNVADWAAFGDRLFAIMAYTDPDLQRQLLEARSEAIANGSTPGQADELETALDKSFRNVEGINATDDEIAVVKKQRNKIIKALQGTL